MNYGTVLAANKPPEQAVNLSPQSALSTKGSYDGELGHLEAAIRVLNLFLAFRVIYGLQNVMKRASCASGGPYNLI